MRAAKETLRLFSFKIIIQTKPSSEDHFLKGYKESNYFIAQINPQSAYYYFIVFLDITFGFPWQKK